MFKNIIAPMQAWLLSQGKCVGCGKKLPGPGAKNTERVTCACGRIYMFDPQAKRYRRATLDEIK
jgi:DNA-directed RNA polymerase subunit RPC12/RpoP